MIRNNQRFNQDAAKLSPEELEWPPASAAFALPDFRDVTGQPEEVLTETRAAELPVIAAIVDDHPRPEPEGAREPSTAIPVESGPSSPTGKASTAFEGLLAEPDLLLPPPGVAGVVTEERILLGPALFGCEVDCEPLSRRISQLDEAPSSGVLLFCDVDDGIRAGIAAGAVARMLAASGKAVLLIDSDLERGELTGLVAARELAGAREFLRAMNAWQSLACPTDVAGVSMIPCGKQKLRFTEPSAFVEGVCRKSLGQMLERFSHVLVTSGTAFDNSLLVWRGFCSATVVTLDAANSSRSIAQAAVRELNSAGCRVMGCLPTPVRRNKAPDRALASQRAA